MSINDPPFSEEEKNASQLVPCPHCENDMFWRGGEPLPLDEPSQWCEFCESAFVAGVASVSRGADDPKWYPTSGQIEAMREALDAFWSDEHADVDKDEPRIALIAARRILATP